MGRGWCASWVWAPEAQFGFGGARSRLVPSRTSLPNFKNSGSLPAAQLLLENKKKKRKGDRREKSGGGFRTRWVSGKSLKASAKCNGSWHTQVLWSILPSHKVFQLQMTRPGALCLLAWACWRWPASSAPTSPASARGIIDLTEGWR